jgi:hypothetical protein
MSAISEAVYITFADIDWDEMRAQKELLFRLAEKHPRLEGVISVYDCIQDQAAEMGHPVLWITEG